MFIEQKCMKSVPDCPKSNLLINQFIIQKVFELALFYYIFNGVFTAILGPIGRFTAMSHCNALTSLQKELAR